jgi:hypothetical protein
MDGHPPFRSTYPRSDLGRPRPSSPPARPSSPSLSSFSFPGRLSYPVPHVGLSGLVLPEGRDLPSMGGRFVTSTPTSTSSVSAVASSSTQPRVVSGARNLNSLLNHNHDQDHDDRVPSPRPPAPSGRYQTNRLTGLPSPENSPPLRSRPRQHLPQHQIHRLERMDMKPFLNRAEDSRRPLVSSRHGERRARPRIITRGRGLCRVRARSSCSSRTSSKNSRNRGNHQRGRRRGRG